MCCAEQKHACQSAIQADPVRWSKFKRQPETWSCVSHTIMDETCLLNQIAAGGLQVPEVFATVYDAVEAVLLQGL